MTQTLCHVPMTNVQNFHVIQELYTWSRDNSSDATIVGMISMWQLVVFAYV